MADLAEVRAMADWLIELHLGQEKERWTFNFDYARKRGGLCNHGTRVISMSRYLCEIWDLEHARQTMLHEIAHALVGRDHQHSRHWLDVARSIGYEGGVSHQYAVAEHLAPWRGTCPSGHTIVRFKRPPRKPVSCAKCSPRFSKQYRITWEFVG